MFSPTKHSRLCSVHFEEESFELDIYSQIMAQEHTKRRQGRRLKAGSKFDHKHSVSKTTKIREFSILLAASVFLFCHKQGDLVIAAPAPINHPTGLSCLQLSSSSNDLSQAFVTVTYSQMSSSVGWDSKEYPAKPPLIQGLTAKMTLSSSESPQCSIHDCIFIYTRGHLQWRSL